MSIKNMVQSFAEIVGQKQSEDLEDLYFILIEEEFEEWKYSLFDDEEIKELADLLYVIYGYCYHKGWDIDEAVRRVHVNNIGRCVQPDGTIKRREDGKIIKNKNYPKVYLGDLIK